MADGDGQLWVTHRKMVILRAVSMVVGCLGMALSGSVFVYNAYSNALKAMFNMTQSQVELKASLAFIGATIGFPAGLMLEHCGPVLTALVGLIVTVSSFTVLWSTTLMRSFYHFHTYLLDILYTVAGFGGVFMYMVSITTNMQNFSRKHRGKVVGTLDAAFSAGPTLLALLYGAAFVQGHVEDEENQKVGEYFILLAVANAIIGVLQMMFIRVYPIEEEDITTDEDITTEKENFSADDIGDTEISNLLENPSDLAEPEVNLWGRDLLINFNFHLIAWPFIFCSALQMVVINNLAVYLKSAHLEKHSTLLTTLSPLTCMLIKIFIGFTSDKFIHNIPRVVFLLGANIFQTITIALCILWSDSLALLVIITVTTGFANGSCWCLTPTMLSEEFGMKHFGWNWGWCMLSSAVLGWILQELFGIFYQEVITSGHGASSTQCLGPACFKWSFVIATVFSALSVVLNILLAKRKPWNVTLKSCHCCSQRGSVLMTSTNR